MNKFNNALVSVIVPMHNAEAYIAECLDSIFSQDYTPIEVIVINDSSKAMGVRVLQRSTPYSCCMYNIKMYLKREM